MGEPRRAQLVHQGAQISREADGAGGVQVSAAAVGRSPSLRVEHNGVLRLRAPKKRAGIEPAECRANGRAGDA